MKKAILMCGREQDNDFYQILIGNKLNSAQYNKLKGNYQNFLEGLGKEYADKIISSNEALELGISNGWKLDTTSGQTIKINKLDSKLVHVFSNQIIKNLEEITKGGVAMLIPTTILN
ncbi:hypothetical protein KAT80_02875 [Candidatus Pacearchaeota archaeon]|nr:hypothetical protein [Candidatus Pacearchaeota archaeon]